MTSTRKAICILTPAFNEQETLPELYARLVEVAAQRPDLRFEFFFVNDGSTDATLAILRNLAMRDPRVSWIDLSRNFGKEIAMIAGLDEADADATVIIDADLQDPPELILQMIPLWEQGYEDVYARRRSRGGESWLKRWTSSVYYRMLQRTTHIQLQQDTGDFRLLDRRCVDALRQFRETERYTKGMFSWIGFRKREIAYDRQSRAAGTTKWRYGQLFDLAIDGFTSFTTAPLRWSTVFGFAVSAASFVAIVVILLRILIWGVELPGHASLMTVVLFLGGVQLLSLGIIGEYVGRIFTESKHRPLYLVQERYRSAEEWQESGQKRHENGYGNDSAHTPESDAE